MYARCNEKRKGTLSDENSGQKWTNAVQKRLEKLLDDGHLTLTDSGSKVKDLDDSFDVYSNNVIGYHLGQLRKKKLSSSSKTPTGPVNSVLTQLGVVSPPAFRPEAAPIVLMDVDESDMLRCNNMPFVRFTYMDYESKQEKIAILLDLPGGSGTFDWEFNDVGDWITLNVEWSRALYDVSNLFRRELEAKLVTLDHPKLHSMQDTLLRKGITAKQIPRCCFHIPLGKKVHKDDGTWDVQIVQHEGNKIIFIEFSGFQEEVLKKYKRGTFTN